MTLCAGERLTASKPPMLLAENALYMFDLLATV